MTTSVIIEEADEEEQEGDALSLPLPLSQSQPQQHRAQHHGEEEKNEVEWRENTAELADEEDEARTLVGFELGVGEESKLREGDVIKEIEISDDEDYDDDHGGEDYGTNAVDMENDGGALAHGAGPNGGGLNRGTSGLRRKRTIRVVIRSRAFL